MSSTHTCCQDATSFHLPDVTAESGFVLWGQSADPMSQQVQRGLTVEAQTHKQAHHTHTRTRARSYNRSWRTLTDKLKVR